MAAVALCAGAAGGAGAARTRLPHFLLDARSVPPDTPVFVCAEGAAHPETLWVNAPRSDSLGGVMPPVQYVVPWPERGPAELLAAVPGLARATEIPAWGHDGYLPPGTYVLSASGFAPETLTVRPPTDAERRQRAVLARARLQAEAGDSALAVRLVERLRALEPDCPYDDAAFLALGRLWRYSSLRERPEEWLSMWIARHHSRCAVGEGIRVWLESVPEPLASEVLRRIVSRYPDTRASAAAAEWLSARGKAPK